MRKVRAAAAGLVALWCIPIPAEAQVHEQGRAHTTERGSPDEGSKPPDRASESPPPTAQPEADSNQPSKAQVAPRTPGTAARSPVDIDSTRASTEATGPALPVGMTLDETLARAAQPPPANFPNVVDDDRILGFLRGDQAEYRLGPSSDLNLLGWEINAWVGGDFNRLVLKSEGELNASEWDEGESETDILYSRLVLPFWSAQVGAQYANEWSPGEAYADRFAGAVAFQGLAPGKFEVDASIYLSEDLDVTGALELEYDYRITQRLVAQPRAELSFSARDIEERSVGAGLTDLVAGLRLRYEIKREFAPYLGLRYQRQFFGTADRARAIGQDVAQFHVLGGVRFALL